MKQSLLILGTARESSSRIENKMIRKFLDTSLHQLLYIKNFSLEYLFKVIYKSDLNIQNIDGKTALHLILRKRK